ncbi:MAG: Wzz/FepE/Etk N-terminal domain-containing protein [[Clostridium] scindens]
MEEMRRENEEMEIDLLEIAHLLWRKAWAILLCLIIGAALVGSYTKFLVTPQYSASSMIYVLTKTTTVTSITDLRDRNPAYIGFYDAYHQPSGSGRCY